MPHPDTTAGVLNIPNILSVVRLVLAPALLWLAYSAESEWFLYTLIVSLLTDAVDGKIARWLQQTSELGTRLDSWADFATYMSVPVCAYWLRPDLVRSEAPFFWTVVACFAAPVAVGLVKFRSLTSYHTRGAVVAAYLLGGSVIVIFANGPTWPFRLAAMALVVAELEEIAITLVLPEIRSNVPSLRHALRIREELLAPGSSAPVGGSRG